MNFWGTNQEMESAVHAIALRALKDHAVEDIVEVGFAVSELLSRFRRDHAEQVPLHPGNDERGLLAMHPRAFDDFELAQHLIEIGNPEMVGLCTNDKGVPATIAFLAIATTTSSTNSEIDLKKAWDWVLSADSFRVDQLELAVEARQAAADHGSLFKGRKPGSYAPVTKKVNAYLKKEPGAKSVEVWNAVKASPPKGYVFMETERFGRYIEKDAKTVMEWPAFQNLVSRRRPEKKPRKSSISEPVK
jgi:hypothetical protein